MKRRFLLLSAAVGAFAMSTSLLPAFAADAELMAAAEAEGEVLFYSSAPPTALEKVVESFNEKHPKITARYFRAGTTELLSRLEAEVNAKRLEADVVHVSSRAEIERFRDMGALEPYRSPEYDAYPPRDVDADNTYFVARTHLWVLSYNTKSFEGQDPPKTWADLVDPRFKNKIGIIAPMGVGGFYYFRYAMWSIYGDDYIRKLAANMPMVDKGSPGLHERIVSGEVAMGADLNYLVEHSFSVDQAPIKAVFPPEGVPALRSPAAIMAGAAHPAAAKVFIDFLASKEGQEAFNSAFTYSARADVEPVAGLTPKSEIVLLDYSTEDLASQFDHLQALTAEAFGVK